jgi:hypothetical protein
MGFPQTSKVMLCLVHHWENYVQSQIDTTKEKASAFASWAD